MKFGDMLRVLLDEKSITQKQLAENLNIAPSTIGNYIRNLREPDFETIRKIAAFFSVSIDYLMDFHNNNEYSPLETDLLRVFRALTPEQQMIYLEQGKAFLPKNPK